MLHFDGQLVHCNEKTLTISELFETYNALGDEPLAQQNDLFRQVLDAALDQYRELSETARLHYDFWRNLMPQHIETRTFSYTTKVTHTYQWELSITPEGLLYKDLSDAYSPYRKVEKVQGFSDFWFYGPVLPMPELETRKWAQAILRNTFRQVGGAAYNAPFPLLDYPRLDNPRHWSFGNYKASDFVNMRDYGVDYGSENFHDGPVFLGFISYEQCLTRPAFARDQLGEEPWSTVVEFLRPGSALLTPNPVAEGTTTAPLSATERQEQSNVLWNEHRDEKAVVLLLELLQEDDPEHYWRNYVFNTLFDMRESRKARAWMVRCLEGDNEVYFNKAVEVLHMWGMTGEYEFAEPELIRSLRWSARQAGDSNFVAARQSAIQLLNRR
ncbi:MAG: hypothetical protein IT260_07610 [Saprospiraceae bacterium]|nr:hypothetical protein [Saprospiraceae bacterium]